MIGDVALRAATRSQSDRHAVAVPHRTGRSLWSRRQRGVLLGSLTLGLVLIAAGWFGSSDEVLVGPQTRWLVLALVGLALFGMGATWWTLSAYRMIVLRRRDLLPLPDSTSGAAPSAAAESEGPPARPVAVAGLAFFHRPDCLLVRGKAATEESRPALERAGRRPCGVCRP